MEKRDYIKHIVFTGPECSGKTTLSKMISKKFNFPLVTEYARLYLSQLNRAYEYDDLIQIAQGQIQAEHQKKKQNPTKKILICDTDLQVLKIWSKVKFSRCDSFILKNQNPNALYVLCVPDFKWEQDPLRENPHNRQELFKMYENDLLKNNRDFITVSGSIEKRITYLSNTVPELKHRYF